jgi:hypothetical protein
MSRTAYKYSAVIVSLLVSAMLTACGSDHREANANPANVARVADEAVCRTCHAATLDPVSGTPIVADFLTATNSHNQAGRTNVDLGCEGCHGGGAEHNGVGPIPFPNPLTANRCITCHTAGGLADTSQNLAPLFELAKAGFLTNNCAHCHTASGVGSIHGAKVPETDDCVFCHQVAAPNHGAGLVNDNSGVRAVTTEFGKWSHHVTGVTLDAAHCAACHLEGTVVAGAIVVDQTKHMADAQVHLRNAGDDSDIKWDPAAPNHTNMDNFCMSCHDANGATSPVSLLIQSVINNNHIAALNKVASPKNPFGDTISNRYDKMQRPGVTDVSDQFNTTNNSHHGVKGRRYTGRTRVAGAPRAIAAPLTFASHSSAALFGARSTIFDAGNFNQLYVPLANAGGEAAPRTGSATLGDDSTLHCGDCHTVGQWKVGSSTSADGTATPVAIGAHGSNNEYLLRNSLGTDQRHAQNAYLVGNAGGTVLNPFTGVAIPNGQFVVTNPNGAFLVCYNCHAYLKYGIISLTAGAAGNGHAGEYDEQGRCNGIGNTLPFNGYTTGTATDGTQFLSRFEGPLAKFGARPASATGFPLVGSPPVGEQDPDFGDIFGIQCLNCHNSGLGNAYGGIHGSFNNTNSTLATVSTLATAAGVTVTGGAYIDGMGNVSKVERFLPGLGNAMYVPGVLGGITGGASATVAMPANARAGTPAYTLTYTTGGVNNDTNWEQKLSAPPAGTPGGLLIAGVPVMAGAGCYTLGAAPAATAALRGPSVTGEGGPASIVLNTWGGCVDHNAPQGGGDHGIAKKINRPVTY